MNENVKKESIFKKIFGKKGSIKKQTTIFADPQNSVLESVDPNNLNVIDNAFDTNFELETPDFSNQNLVLNDFEEVIPQNLNKYIDDGNQINQDAIFIDEPVPSGNLDIFKHDDNFFNEPGRIIYSSEKNPAEVYGVPFDIRYDHKKLVEKNLSFKNLYTKEDIEKFELPESMFIKFYKNGSIFYKLKKEFDVKTFDIYSIFKLNTTFSKFEEIKSTLVNDSENAENKSVELDLNISADAKKSVESNDEKSSDDKDASIVLFDSWQENPFNSAVLNTDSEEEWKRNDLRTKIFKLNQEIEQQINRHKMNMIGKTDTEKKALDLKHQEIRESISELNQSFPNEQILFKIQRLIFLTFEENNIYYGHKLENINFDVYPNDRIVVVSDDSITNQLLIDVLRGDEVKTSGYVYKNFSSSNQWIDVSSLDNNSEITEALASPDYLSLLTKKKEKVVSAMKKIFNKLDKDPSALFISELAEKMHFSDYLTKNIFDLDDLALEKFFTMCDILIGKKVILIKSICQDMSLEQRIQFLSFLDSHFKAKNITAIYATENVDDVNLFGNKIMVLKQGQLMDFMSSQKILQKFDSLDAFVNYYLTYGTTNNF